MKRKLLISTLILMLTATAAMASDHWLHIRVQEHNGAEERVNVNIPLSMVRGILPLIDDEEFNGGRIRIHDHDWDDINLPQIMRELRDAPDAEYVTVKSRDENVRVAKENGYFLVRAEERDGNETVNIKMPLAVVDAMFTGRSDEIDLIAALDALTDHADGDLITVESDDTSVRIWIDRRQGS